MQSELEQWRQELWQLLAPQQARQGSGIETTRAGNPRLAAERPKTQQVGPLVVPTSTANTVTQSIELSGDGQRWVPLSASEVVPQPSSTGNDESGGPTNTEQTNGLTSALNALLQTVRDETEALKANTQALGAGGNRSGNSSAGSTGGSIVSSLLSPVTNLFGIGSLVKGIAGLFGGGGSKNEPALTAYQAPAPIYIEQTLQPLRPEPTVRRSTIAEEQERGPKAAVSSPITVNIQALDSRSFLDRSSEIADAVRQAMLQSHALTDVIVEL